MNAPKIREISLAVAAVFNVPLEDLRKKSNLGSIVRPRQVAMYLARKLTCHSLPEIGRAFGGKHHTTVLHAVRRIERERARSEDLNDLVESLMRKLPKRDDSPWPRRAGRNDFSRLTME